MPAARTLLVALILATSIAAGCGDSGGVTKGKEADRADVIAKDSARGATQGGMEIYQFTESGIALQATVSGTKYWKDGKLNQ